MIKHIVKNRRNWKLKMSVKNHPINQFWGVIKVTRELLVRLYRLVCLQHGIFIRIHEKAQIFL